MPSKLLQKTAAVVCAAAALCFWRPVLARAAEEPWYFGSLGVKAARDAGLSGAGVKIALIDSGVNASHEDLADADITGYNFLGSEPYADVSAYGDDLGHGTLVCGILAATAGNGLGTDGLVPDASVLMLRCFSSLGGSANAGSGAKETIRRAVEYAIEADADVLNMSIGGTKQSLQELEPVFRQAADAGILLIASVGNGGCAALVTDFAAYNFNKGNFNAGEPFDKASEIRGGDVIQLEGHFFAVVSRTGDKLFTFDGNFNSTFRKSKTAYSIANGELKGGKFLGGWHFMPPPDEKSAGKKRGASARK